MTYTGPDRRTLDPNVRAEYWHYDGAFEVRTGLSGRIGPMPFDEASTMAWVHNTRNGHQAFRDRRNVASVSTPTADLEAAIEHGDIVNGQPVTRRERRILRERAL